MSTDLIEALHDAPQSARLWTAWYKQTHPSVYFAAYRFAHGNRDAARELTQETFTRFIHYDAIRRVTNEQHARAFLITTCRNLAIDRDQRAREISLEDIPESLLTQPPEAPVADERGIEELLQVLNSEDRQLIEWTQEGFTVAEIAQKLDITYTAAGVRLHRVRRRLQKKLSNP